ncbi:MAG: hypothetical protein KA886_00790 [Candidatus Cloacimonetes bacterium]|nr:hypothetical protein [Candidatus Cloacimonadota bacterium]
MFNHPVDIISTGRQYSQEKLSIQVKGVCPGCGRAFSRFKYLLTTNTIVKGKYPYCGNEIDSLECRVFTEKIVTPRKVDGILIYDADKYFCIHERHEYFCPQCGSLLIANSNEPKTFIEQLCE